ncbi:TIGR02647 family protein [Psychromonas sp. 14N.309.X.WAT.B.A12]|uniref:TIGR02647 family protein n=1 Tax=Psychromonas sp. 14N.309.X.WAT.B.A12 TaxID=2998322 RepID=UPI0025AF99DD|nr:TIGR02647 family protein [Psychromonas sp. 14N.309.X.WAT.B.A12]MDN2662014.1 TIGR02647 family protein [Psychromonas sp. 14N.309.X.WAT.B.A12]
MTKNYSDTLLDEIKLLAKFPETSQLEGLKIHKEADPSVIKAAQSLFEKGLISQQDGGYLTDSGLETADHLHHLLIALH